jgi:phosphate acetyltransferase
MDIFKRLELKAKKNLRTIILPESYDERVIAAAKVILKKGLAKIIMIDVGKPKAIPLPEHKNLDIIDIHFAKQFAMDYYRIRSRKNPDLTHKEAEEALSDPLTFSCMLLKNGFADAVVAGSLYSTSSVLRNAIQVIGLAKNNKTVSSFFLFTFPKGSAHAGKVLAYGDCGVLPNPTSQQLSDIAVQTSQNYKKLTGNTPKTAFLSFSTKGSAIDKSLDKVIEAHKLTKKRTPGLICDGELQFDAAFVPSVAKRKDPKGRIKGDANVFIFPDLNSGNIAYKITERIGGASATGPIVQGLAQPVMDLSRGCSSEDIIKMVTIASVI